MRKKFIVSGIAILVILLGIGVTTAYFNSYDIHGEVFTVGNVKISLTEEGWNDEEDHVMMPNAFFEKVPSVQNVGENDAYIRLSVKVSQVDLLKAAVLNPDFEPSDLFTDCDASVWIPAGEPVKDDEGNMIYSYYYHRILKPEERTEPIFTGITFPTELDIAGLDALEEDLAVTVSADAIQSDSFQNVEEAFNAFDLEN